MTSLPVLALDIGGTWIKGVCGNTSEDAIAKIEQIPNPAANICEPAEFARALWDFCMRLTGETSPSSVCIATAGEVGPDGLHYLATAEHLGVMGSNKWQSALKGMLKCPFWMLNDAESFLVGAAESRLFQPSETIAALVVGTGLGFCLAKEGRWWKPGRRLPLIGALRTPAGSYDDIASAVRLQVRAGRSLPELFSDPSPSPELAGYLDDLAGIAAGVCCLCFPERLLLGGGLADAASATGFPLSEELARRVSGLLPPGVRAAKVSCVQDANRLTLLGALAIARENAHASAARFYNSYGALPTESPSPAPGIEKAGPPAIVRKLWEEEQKAGGALEASLEAIAAAAADMAETCRNGGRIICVGAGTSGRIAAMDAVEMPCTFGLPRTQFAAIIAGGTAEAAWDIEENGEEDIASVPDLLLMQPGPGDMVVAISVSGSAFFARSALACARHRGARTVFIHETPTESGLSDHSIFLRSGPEVISGSTRMKGGTATKKALNWLGTCAMILIGKTRDGWMIDFTPSNEKLVARATRILAAVSGMAAGEAADYLARQDYRLRACLDKVSRI